MKIIFEIIDEFLGKKEREKKKKNKILQFTKHEREEYIIIFRIVARKEDVIPMFRSKLFKN